MAETMFGVHMSEVQGVLNKMVKEYPWVYAIVLLLVSKFPSSDAGYLCRSGLYRGLRADMLWLLHSADLPKRSGDNSV